MNRCDDWPRSDFDHRNLRPGSAILLDRQSGSHWNISSYLHWFHPQHSPASGQIEQRLAPQFPATFWKWPLAISAALDVGFLFYLLRFWPQLSPLFRTCLALQIPPWATSQSCHTSHRHLARLISPASLYFGCFSISEPQSVSGALRAEFPFLVPAVLGASAQSLRVYFRLTPFSRRATWLQGNREGRPLLERVGSPGCFWRPWSRRQPSRASKETEWGLGEPRQKASSPSRFYFHLFASGCTEVPDLAQLVIYLAF